MLVSDRELAMRINRFSMEFFNEYISAKQAVNSNASLLRIGGGLAVFGGHGDFINGVVAQGFFETLSSEDIEAVERFYQKFDSQPTFEISPMADPSLIHLLAQRAYSVEDFENVWVMDLKEWSPKVENHVVVLKTDQKYSTEWSKAFLRGFELPEDYAEITNEFTSALFSIDECEPYWVLEGDHPVATAMLGIKDGVAWLFATATVPDCRGKGYQSALLNHRLQIAKERGCDIAIVETIPGNQSARNVERVGFRVIYTKVKLSPTKG